MRFLVVGLGSMGKRRIRSLQSLQAGDVSVRDKRSSLDADIDDLYQIVLKFRSGALAAAELSSERGIHVTLPTSRKSRTQAP